MSAPIRTLVAALAILVVACDSSPTNPRIDEATFAPELGIDLAAMTQTGTGLYFQDLVVGTGPAAGVGATVTAYYKGWLTDGTLFGFSVDPDPPIDFRLVPGATISGFGEGLRGMRAGGTRRLIIPPALGYGNSPPPGSGIPRNAILVFEITVVTIQ